MLGAAVATVSTLQLRVTIVLSAVAGAPESAPAPRRSKEPGRATASGVGYLVDSGKRPSLGSTRRPHPRRCSDGWVNASQITSLPIRRDCHRWLKIDPLAYLSRKPRAVQSR